MKAKLLPFCLTLFLTSQAFACSVCYGKTQTKTFESMAVAVWFLAGMTMTVLGGVGAFSFHLWRHGRMPLEPHQQLAEEDLEQYD